MLSKAIKWKFCEMCVLFSGIVGTKRIRTYDQFFRGLYVTIIVNLFVYLLSLVIFREYFFAWSYYDFWP